MSARHTGVVVLLGLLLAPASLRAADPQIVDLTGAFARTYDATKDKPAAERVAAFRRDVEPLFPSFYGIARFEGRRTQEARDAQIARAFDRFPQIRETYLAKARLVQTSIGADMKRFRAAFPDFVQEQPIYLLHSLGEMDGGTRMLDGAPKLIFGADVMATAHEGWRTESAFFHHELFHIHHHPKFGECDEVWCMLWIEGAAVYVAAALNPGMTDKELLLDFPAGTADAVRATSRAGAAHLLTVLDSKDESVMGALFSTVKDGTGLPPRRGYGIGYLVAQEIGRGRALKDLPHIPRARVRTAVEKALQALSQK